MLVSLPFPCLNADGGGGGGPVASPFTGGGRGGGQRQSQEGGEGDSPADILAQLQAEIRQANQRAAQADQRTQGLAGVLGNVQKAFSGEKEVEQDWYEDQLLPHLLELEKDGKSHPMTATLARELRKSQEGLSEYAQAIAQLKAEIAELKNPNTQNDDRAFAQIDDVIVDELTSVYGEHSAPLHRAVAANIAADIARIQKEFPHKWEEVRRDQNKLAKIVKYHVAAIIPPVAKQAIAKQIDDNTPVTMQTLNSAWAEFQQIKHTLDPQARGEIAANLRQQILSQQFMQNRRLPGQPRRR